VPQKPADFVGRVCTSSHRKYFRGNPSQVGEIAKS
jgi:hypothetical protein